MLNLTGDFYIYHKAYELVNYKYKKFPSNLKQIISDSLYNISEEKQKSTPDKSVIKSNELVIEKYNRVINLELKNVGNLESMQHFFDNTIWEYAMIAFIVMLTVRMFTMDISCGAYKRIYSSKKGQRHLFKKQFFAVLLVITVITVVVALIQLICGITLFGVTKFSLPLQMHPDFEFCPYLISIGGFLSIKFLCKLLFYIMIATVTSMVSVLFRKQLSSFAVSLVIGVLPLIAITYFFVYTTNDTSAISTKYKIYDNMRGFVPHGLLNIRNYFRTFDYINLFGLQISRIILALAITILITIICFIFAFKNYGISKEVTI